MGPYHRHGRGCLARGSEPAGPILLSQAAELGTFNVGPARAAVRRVSDAVAGVEVLTLDYTIPRGAAAGLYAKAFPGGLDADRADLVRLAVKANDADGARQVTVAVEIKGAAGVQRIPLKIYLEWTPSEVLVDWPAVGALREIVVSVNPAGDGAPVEGSIAIDGRFEKLSVLRKLSMSPLARIGGVLLASLVVAVLLALLRGAIKVPSETNRAGTVEAFPLSGSAAESSWARQLKGDLVRGGGAVLIGLLVIEIILIGDKGRLEAGWTALGIALAGAAIAEWWKFGLTGQHLTAREVFQDMAATGLPAASASSLAILQAPANWSELFMLSQAVAAATVLVYHAANACRLASTSRHVDAAGAALLVGTPYVIGGLTLLESGGLLQELGGVLTAGAFTAWPAVRECVGRVFVIFCFNEAVANGLGLATKGRPLKSLGAHLAMTTVAGGVVAAPWIAGFGSGETVAAWSAVPRLLATVVTTIFSQAGLWAQAYLITGMAMDAIHGHEPSRASVTLHPILGMKKGMVYSGTFMGCVSVVGTLAEVSFLRSIAFSQPVLTATVFGALAFPLLKTIIETFDGSQAFFRRVRRSYESPILYLRGAMVGLGLGSGLTLAMAEKDLATRVGFGFGIGALAYAGIDLLRDILNAARERGQVQAARYYLVHALLGGFIGAAIGFYLDAAQVSVVVAKFHRYLAAGLAPQPYRNLSPGQQMGSSPSWGRHGRGERAVRRGAGGRD